MNCEICHKQLIPYQEGLLKGPALQEMEQHLQECSSCRSFAGYLKETLLSIENSRLTAPDPFFYTRVKARLEKQVNSSSVKSGWIRILQPAFFTFFLAAAIYAGILLGGLYGNSETKSYARENLDPWVNELGSEPLETFLMN